MENLIIDGAINANDLKKAYFWNDISIITSALGKGNALYDGLSGKEIGHLYDLIDEATLKNSTSARDQILNLFERKKK